MLELKPKPTDSPRTSRQYGRLLFALAVLLIALAIVFVGDREYWFGSDHSSLDSDAADQVAQRTTPKPVATPAQPAPVTAAPVKKQTAPAKATQPKTGDSLVVSRTVLPSMDVEVVAGDTHRTVHAGSNASKLQITNPATNAAERERISSPATPPANASVQASYPLLAQQMRVQGSVVLQAVISAEGAVQNIRVLAGPAILTAAAQQAVREWRFKPVLQNGQPVETQAKITVNFTIKVADGSANTTLAESRSDEIRILSR